MLFKQTKNLLLLLVCFLSIAATAQNSPLDEENTMAVETSDVTEESNVTAFNSQACPTEFFQVPIPVGGKLCQIFATDLPASMVLYVPQTPQSVVDFYQNNDQFQTANASKQRYLIQSKDNNITVIVSADGAGSQVDILVKQDPTQ